MIISCPNCSTTYKVDNATLGPQGKSVRCSNCEHQWHQLPMKEPDVRQANALASQTQMQPAAMVDPTVLQAQIIAQMQAMVATNQIPQFGQMNAAVQPAQEMTPEIKPQPKPEQELPEETPPSQEELNKMFGEDEPKPPVSLMGDEEIDKDDGYDNLDDIPEPDPIPESLMSKDAYDQEDEDDEEDEDEDEKSSSIGLILGIVVSLLIIGTAVIGFFLRDMIQEMVPQTKPYYELIGLIDPLGTGFDIQNVRSEREQEGKIDVLNVTGTIVNVSDKMRKVPLIRISLFNEEREEVQFINLTPDVEEILAGEKINFKGSIMDPSTEAKKMEVTFTDSVVTEEVKE